MKKNVRNIGLMALAAGALVYPAILLIRAISRNRNQIAGRLEDGMSHVKHFAPAYRGMKSRRHKAEANGQHHDNS